LLQGYGFLLRESEVDEFFVIKPMSYEVNQRVSDFSWIVVKSSATNVKKVSLIFYENSIVCLFLTASSMLKMN
jgi:hypothetical protein